MMTGRVVLVKHAMPVLDAGSPARDWALSEAGERDARRLGASLARFRPNGLLSSPEPKARRTAEIIAKELDVRWRTVEAFREIDRPALPIMAPEEHLRFNSRLFAEPERASVGTESASAALERFGTTLRDEVFRTGNENPIVVSHGTVISLFVARANPHIDAFRLWRRLQCPSFVVVELPSFALVEVVERLDNQSGMVPDV